MIVKSAGGDVNKALSLLDGAIRGEWRVDVQSYRNLTYQYQGGASKNWDRVALALDFAHMAHGQPTTYERDVIVDFAWSRVTERDFLLTEGSVLSPIYYEHHTFNPMVAVYGCALQLIEDDVVEGLDDTADALRWWLRACVLNAAKLAQHVVPKGITSTQANGGIPFGPGVMRAAAPPYSYSPPIAIAACGRRGWDLDGDRWPWYVAQAAAGHSVAQFGLGQVTALPCKVAEAIKDAFGIRIELFDPYEQEKIHDLISGDVEALKWALNEISDRYPHDRVREIRRTGGVTSILLQSSKGPTSAKVAHTVLSDGTGLSMGVDSPHRGTGGEWNRPHYTVIDSAATNVRGVADADDRQPFTTVDMEIAPGETIWDFEWGGGQPMVVHHPPGLLEEEPVPEPTGPADAFDWLRNADAYLAAVGDGFFSTISPVAFHPHLFVLRKGPGVTPWATELLWRDEAADRIALVAECGYDAAGNICNIRTFWEDDGTPGVTWLPRWIDRQNPMQYQTTGWLVENAITGTNAPYRPDGTQLKAGEFQIAKVDAQTTLTHLGVDEEDLGEPVAFLARSDRMGSADHVNVETYDIGFGRGAYGYTGWISSPANGEVKHLMATHLEQAGRKCLFYGVDPLDPDAMEKWFYTVDYAGEVPPDTRATRRPDQADEEVPPTGNFPVETLREAAQILEGDLLVLDRKVADIQRDMDEALADVAYIKALLTT